MSDQAAALSNLKLQLDEIESLSSIYGEEFTVIDEAGKMYRIVIEEESACDSEGSLRVELEVTLPAFYPSEGPPTYQVNAPWMRGTRLRCLIDERFATVYLDQLGEPVVYRWVESLRDFLREHLLPSGGESGVAGEGGNLSDSDACGEEEAQVVDLNLAAQLQAHWDLGRDSGPSKKASVEIQSGDTLVDRRSVFQAHIARVKSMDEVNGMLAQLNENRKIAHASHNIYAYRFRLPPAADTTTSPVVCSGCDDDGEKAAGGRLLHLLSVLGVEDVAVVVSRWFGGILLGADRFKDINNAARNALQEFGYLGGGETASKSKKRPK